MSNLWLHKFTFSSSMNVSMRKALRPTVDYYVREILERAMHDFRNINLICYKLKLMLQHNQGSLENTMVLELIDMHSSQLTVLQKLKIGIDGCKSYFA